MEGTAFMPNTPDQDFQVIFQTYYSKVVRQITGLIGQKSVAEDLAQEVFLRLYHLDWVQIGNLNAWLTRSSLNAACNYLRGEKRRIAREESDYTRASFDRADSSDELLIREETRHLIMDILNALEERERHLLLLKTQGYSYQEIAKALGLKSSSVGTLLARAKQQFKMVYEMKEGCSK